MLRYIVAVLCVSLIGGAVSDPLYFYNSGVAGGGGYAAAEDESSALEEALSLGDRDLERPSRFAVDPTKKLREAGSVLKSLFDKVDQDEFVFKVVFGKDSDSFSLVFEPKGGADQTPATSPPSGESKEKGSRLTIDQLRDQIGSNDFPLTQSKRGQRASKTNKSPPSHSKSQNRETTRQSKEATSTEESGPEEPRDIDESSVSDEAVVSASEPADVESRVQGNGSEAETFTTSANFSGPVKTAPKMKYNAGPLTSSARQQNEQWPPFHLLVLAILIKHI